MPSHPGSSLKDIVELDVNGSSGTLSVLQGDGSVGLQSPYVIPFTLENPQCIVAADLNGDGAPDIVVACENFGRTDLVVFINKDDGSASFESPYTVVLPYGTPYLPLSPSSMAAGNFYSGGDRRQSILLAENYEYSFSYSNTHARASLITLDKDGVPGSYSYHVLANASGSVTAQYLVATGYLEGSAAPDDAIVIYSNSDAGRVNVFPGDGSGSISRHEESGISTYIETSSPTPFDTPAQAAVADVNGDGLADVVVTNGGEIGVMLSNGDGSLSTATGSPFFTSQGADQIAIANVDPAGGSDLDLILSGSVGLTGYDPSVSFGESVVSVYQGYGDGTFKSGANRRYFEGYAAGGNSLAVDDLSGDGRPDIVTDGNGTVNILQQNAYGSFVGEESVRPTGETARSVAVGDFEPGDLEGLAVTGYNYYPRGYNVSGYDGIVGTLNGDGVGGLSAATRHPAAFQSHAVVAIKPLAESAQESYATLGHGNVVISRGSSSGGSSDYYVYSASAGNFQSPAFQDVVGGGSNGVDVFLYNGHGAFALANVYSVGGICTAVVVGNFNGASEPEDIVAGNIYDNNITILRGSGDGDFTKLEPQSLDYSGIPSDYGPVSMAVGYFGGDSHPSIIVGEGFDLNSGDAGSFPGESDTTGFLLLLPGNGDGTFGSPELIASGIDPHCLAVADLNGDGYDDVITCISAAKEVIGLMGTGNSTEPFDSPKQLGLVDFDPTALATADFNNDGQPDIAVVGNQIVDTGPRGLATVLLNTTFTDTTWVGTSGGGDGVNWDDADNWSGKAVPNETDDAIIPSGFTGIEIESGEAADPGMLTMQSGSAVTVENGGSLTLDGPSSISNGAKLTVDSSATLTVNSHATLTVSGTVAGIISNSGNVAVSGGTSTHPVLISQIIGNGTLTVGTPSTSSYLQFPYNESTRLWNTFNALVINSGSTIDVTKNNLEINYGSSADPSAALVAALTAGYNVSLPLWTGTAGAYGAIVSSSAAANNAAGDTPIFSLGYGDGDVDTGLGKTTATPATPGQFLIKFTLAGDANLDGNVDFDDLFSVGKTLNTTGNDWASGDFNYDTSGESTFNDLFIIGQNLNKTIPAADWLTYLSTHGTGVTMTEVSNGDGGFNILIAGGTTTGDMILFEVDAATGDLVTTFGTDGIVLTNINGLAAAEAIAVRGDGDIVIAGYGTDAGDSDYDVAVAEFYADGTPVTSFGDDGVALSDVGATSDGKAYAFGITLLGTSGDGDILISGVDGDGLVLEEFTTAGALDTSFGSGGVVSDLDIDVFTPNTVTVLASGNILVSGGDGTDAVLAEFNSDGTLDTSFGSGGVVVSSQANVWQSIVILSGGDILAVGVNSADGGQIVLGEFQSDGSANTSFGTSGFTYYDAYTATSAVTLNVSEDGEILVGAISDPEGEAVVLAQFTSAGALDTTYGDSGATVLWLDSGSVPWAIAPDGSGGVLVIGSYDAKLYIADVETGS